MRTLLLLLAQILLAAPAPADEATVWAALPYVPSAAEVLINPTEHQRVHQCTAGRWDDALAEG